MTTEEKLKITEEKLKIAMKIIEDYEIIVSELREKINKICENEGEK